ncbi:integrase catalytic domain-containing protein [Trichonephila clavata]|uniref:Integrase catalytic domain-containing protein n=1 Tax=Trichonephila clavata TaxID=2740835 RepID=A0A8X6FUA9_TRICU|nr:integrase catalytic domain-containing protein [Trichonephila clavata]
MSKEILVVLNRKRGSVKAQLTRIKDFINNPDEKDKIKMESKMDTLKSLRIKLSDIRNEYYEVLTNESDLEPLKLEILDLEDDYEDIQVRIKNIISKIDLKNNNVTSCGNSFNNIKLPDIQLPRFNGSYHDWFNFKEQFISLIDSNNSLTDSQKLYYLKSTLTGISKDVITIDDSYTSLFECLKKRFENKKLIINSHFNEILSLEKFTHESAKNLRTLIDCCQKHLRGAEATLANIRNSFWIPSARNVVRKILRTCITCRKVSAKGSQQLMADLPAARVTACRVFGQSMNCPGIKLRGLSQSSNEVAHCEEMSEHEKNCYPLGLHQLTEVQKWYRYAST